MRIEVPEPSVVVLVGASGCGKSTFAKKHFKHTEILSSDTMRGWVEDDENSLDATGDAFAMLHELLRVRLKRMKTCVIDATNVQREARAGILKVAREMHMQSVAIVLNVGEKVCYERNEARPDRTFGPHVVRNQTRDMKRSLGSLRKEGFRQVYILDSVADVEAVEIVRTKLWNDKRELTGPFDIIGDVHGCHEELEELLEKLGHMGVRRDIGALPDGETRRTLVFLGDLVDRGPDSPGVLKLVMRLVAEERAICIPGNHDVKLVRKLRGKDVKLTHGLAETVEQLSHETEEFRDQVATFLDGLVSHFVLDEGKLVVAHAGMREDLAGRASGFVREFALYGETTGETDEFGLPVRYNWAAEYRGPARVVYGHTPVPEAEWLNRTIDIDTGCVFGGKLTALRYPELELVSVPAKKVYCEPVRPLEAARTGASQLENDDVLDIEDVSGKRIVHTALGGNLTIREENAIAALETISRFAANPRWLVYLPPTMSPCETSHRDGYLEYPDQALDYFAHHGVAEVVCQEKHMGSRAVVVVCRSEDVAAKRFGAEGELGAILTRTGRRFFGDGEEGSPERQLLARIASAAETIGLWKDLATDWMVLDCELMPWSAKAQELLISQYAPVGAAATHATKSLHDLLERMAPPAEPEARVAWEVLRASATSRQEAAHLYVQAYRRYCWPVHSVDDYRIAPFHLMAIEGRVLVGEDHDHLWHMETLARLAAAGGPVLMHTAHKHVHLESAEERQAAVAWWLELTGRGGEGMVVKPRQFIVRGEKGLVQPAVKCRGPEYLRIIYGPEYLEPANLSRLRYRGLSHKRSMAAREFSLGVEGLTRFVAREPLRRVHECAFGVLAMESEPVDPRL